MTVRSLALTCFLGLPMATTMACGGGDKEPKSAGSIAKALAYESKERSAANAASQIKQAAIAAEKKEEESSEAALKAEIDKVTVAEGKLPKDIKAACQQNVDAYEQFMRDNRDAGIVAPWFDQKTKNLARRRMICQQGTVTAAVCVAHGLANAPDPLFDMGEAGVKRVQVACADKYGKSR